MTSRSSQIRATIVKIVAEKSQYAITRAIPAIMKLFESNSLYVDMNHEKCYYNLR